MNDRQQPMDSELARRLVSRMEPTCPDSDTRAQLLQELEHFEQMSEKAREDLLTPKYLITPQLRH